MDAWSDFFVGELGAAAAFAGLLFVSVSVNLEKILQLGQLADRGLEALILLFLTVIVTSLGLVPGQPARALGGEVLVVALVVLAVVLRLQHRYLAHVDPKYRADWRRTALVSVAAIVFIALAGIAVAATGAPSGFYLLPLGVLLSFFAAGTNAWVLLIEINR